jgi:hypothetical protein
MNEIQEKNILIAERVPPSDRWILLPNQDIVYPSLIEVLNAYHIKAVVKPKAYRLEPMNNKLYAIVESISLMREPKKFDLYGEH